MIRLEEMEQFMKLFKELSKEKQEEILKHDMGSVLNPIPRPKELIISIKESKGS